MRAGFLPLWNPYIFCGMPLHGAAQAGVLFPLNWFYLVFSPPLATNLMMLSTYMVAALGAYLYTRRSGSNIAGAALTSLVWQWSGFLVNQIGHTNIVHTAALLPWLLWAIDAYGESGKKARGLILAILVAVQIFAGHQQTAVYALLVVAAYAVVMSHAARASGKRSGKRLRSESSNYYLASLALVSTGLALAAVQILPTAELLRNSLRATSSYSFFTSFSLPPSFVWTFFAPYVVGGGASQLFRAPYTGPEFYGEYVGYVGLATLILSLLAGVFKRDVRTKFWLVVALIGFVLTLGRFWPFHAYAVIYYLPVLGLFRVPARHLMEVDFALAVLAGRGLTAIIEANDRKRVLRWTIAAGVVVLIMIVLAVTLGRPANFRLGREAPVTFLRAPELFIPVAIGLLTLGALWFLTRHKRGALLLLFAVVALDLNLWGQSTGWHLSSPKHDNPLWQEPSSIKFLRGREGSAAPYRVLTFDRQFSADGPLNEEKEPGRFILELQPNTYMMYGVENAAGYDGFGLARYSRLAGDMKVWGDLTDAERTLRSESRELDLLNVRYLLTRPAANGDITSATTSTSESAAAEFPPATQVYGNQRFGEEDLNLPQIAPGERLLFSVPPTESDRIAVLTSLAWSEEVPDRTVVAHVRLLDHDGQGFNFELRAGEHTSEWAFDRPDIRARIKHQRAPVATSYGVADAHAKYEAHTYVSVFALPARSVIKGGEITVERIAQAPDLTLSVTRIALADGERAYPVRREWLRKEFAAHIEPPASLSERDSSTAARWQHIADVGEVAVFQNTRELPRAWLATGELVEKDEDELSIIRTGKMPDGGAWNPLETALVESATGIHFGKGNEPPGKAEVTRNEANRVDVKTASSAPAILVLSANHYPGWRAYVDGQAVEVMRVNYNQRGVAVPAGNHFVTFLYRPKSLLIGLVISVLALAGLVLWASVGNRRLARTKSRPGSP